MRTSLSTTPLRATVAVLILAGCYHATIETGAPPSQQTIRKGFASGWILGLVPPSTVETQARCPNGVARVETQLSFVNQLVNFLTLGIYTPMQIDVTCAAGQAAGAGPSDEGPRVHVIPRDTAGTPRRAVPADSAVIQRRAEPDEGFPPGTQWVGDRQRRTYVSVNCPAALAIAQADRFYYRTEAAAKADGYTRSDEC